MDNGRGGVAGRDADGYPDPTIPGRERHQPDYALREIIAGKHDAYIAQWARDAAAWGKPFYLRFAHEMNS